MGKASTDFAFESQRVDFGKKQTPAGKSSLQTVKTRNKRFIQSLSSCLAIFFIQPTI
jgi:hypothetical protein